MYLSKKVYAVYNGVWGSGEFSRIFVLKVTKVTFNCKLPIKLEEQMY